MSIVDSHLFSLKILWWGRIGKIAELIAALAIVAELIGAAPIRAFGVSLRNIIDMRQAARSISVSWGFVVPFLSLLRSAFASPPNRQVLAARSIDRMIRNPLFFAWLFLTIVSIAGGIFVFQIILDGWWTWLAGFYVGGALGWSFIPILFMLGAFISWLILLSADLILEAVAAVIDRESIDKWIKGSSVILLVVGFHFDLLSS